MLAAAQIPTNIPLIAFASLRAMVRSVSHEIAAAPNTVPPNTPLPVGLPPVLVSPLTGVPEPVAPPTVIHTVPERGVSGGSDSVTVA